MIESYYETANIAAWLLTNRIAFRGVLPKDGYGSFRFKSVQTAAM
jgi:hypothetical protein